MPLIFQPGHKHLLRQTYTVAILGASALSTFAYAGSPLIYPIDDLCDKYLPVLQRFSKVKFCEAVQGTELSPTGLLTNLV